MAIVVDVQGVLCLTHILLTAILAGSTELCTPCTTGRFALESVCGPGVLECLTTPYVELPATAAWWFRCMLLLVNYLLLESL